MGKLELTDEFKHQLDARMFEFLRDHLSLDCDWSYGGGYDGEKYYSVALMLQNPHSDERIQIGEASITVKD